MALKINFHGFIRLTFPPITRVTSMKVVKILAHIILSIFLKHSQMQLAPQWCLHSREIRFYLQSLRKRTLSIAVLNWLLELLLLTQPDANIPSQYIHVTNRFHRTNILV